MAKGCYVVPLSPEIIEKMGEDKSLYHAPVEEEVASQYETEEKESPSEMLERKWKKYLDIAPLLPQREVDMLEMSFLNKKDQMSIGKIFDVSQGDVSYRIRRVAQRVRYLMSLPRVDIEEMKADLLKILNEEKVTILFLLLETTSQSKVGDKLGLSQGKVRHRYIRALESVKKECYRSPKYLIYYDLLNKLRGNYNSLRSLDIQDRWKYKFNKNKPEF